MGRIPSSCPIGWGANYTVVYGDRMWTVAARYNIPLSELIAANPHITDPHWIYPGDVFCVPVKGPTTGRFLTADYAPDQPPPTSGTVSLYRAYAFTFSRPLTITSLIGGIAIMLGAGVYIAFYTCNEAGVPQELLRYQLMTEVGRRQTINIEPVQVVPGQWYMIAMGAADTANASMAAVGYFDVNDMLSKENIFSAWRPVATELGVFQMLTWTSSQGPPTGIIGRTPTSSGFGVSDARPDLGFFYGGYSFFTLWPKVAGAWKPAETEIRKADGWKPGIGGWVKVDGTWKQSI